MDWKTGSSVATPDGTVYRDHRLQRAAYANAESSPGSTTPERYELPSITRYGLVHVTDGGTRLHEANVTPRDWIAFRACLAPTPGPRRRRREHRPPAPPLVLGCGPRRPRLLDPRVGGAVVPLPAGVAVTTILAIDPGSYQSAWLRFERGRPQGFGITAYDTLTKALRTGGLPDVVVIEKIESYGSAVGAEVFDTVWCTGRFTEAANRATVVMLPRRIVKLTVCGDSRRRTPTSARR